MEQTQGAVMPKRSRNQELQTEKRILQLSVFADVCFVAAELLFAFASHSQSVLMDAAYDGAEMLMMAAAFFGAKVLKDTSLAWMAPYVDQVVALLVVAFALPGAAKMFFCAVKDIFLFAPDEKILEQVKEICEPLLQAYGFEPVFYDVTRTGRRMWVSVYFHMEGDVLSLDCMRQASKEAQKHLCEKWDYCVCELVPEQK